MVLDSAVEDQDRQALEALVVDNPDLARLEALLDRFNIIEALGVVRRELSHSHFLAFLLDPAQPHGLGDAFATRLLQAILREHRDASLPVTPLDLALWDLGGLTVEREWRNIDILLADEGHRLVVLIENKIDTAEHSDQLRRYHDIVRERYPGWRVLALYLTPTGEAPSHEAYLPVSYGTVCTVIEALAEQRASTLGTDVRTLLLHYAQMLRRRVVTDSEIAELCRRIYAKHRRALDLIYEYRVGPQAAVMDLLRELVAGHADLILDQPEKVSVSSFRFAARAWDIPALLAGTGWTPTGRMLLFEIDNSPNGCTLRLYIGPGPQETRQRVVALARRHPKLFRLGSKAAVKWTSIYAHHLVAAYDGVDDEALEEAVRQHWQEFAARDLPRISAAVREELQSWASTETPG